MQTATVTLGRFTLKLSPLPKRELAAAREVWHALAVAKLAPVASAPWFKAHSDALRFVHRSAKGNHRGLSLAELDDEAEPAEIVEAFKALSRLHGAWDGVAKTHPPALP